MKTNNKAQVLANLFHSFIESREETKRTGTISGYKQAMIIYAQFLEKERNIREDELDFSHFNSEYVTAWLTWLRRTRNNDPATCNIRLAQIRAFFKWLKKRYPEYKHIYLDLQDIELLKTENKINAVEAISEAGIKTLIATPGTSTPTGLKYTALMALHYGTGTRTDEVLSIKLGELNLDCTKPNVMVTGKGRKKRVVNIPKPTVRIVKKYIQCYHGDAFDPNAYLFFGKDRKTKLTQSGYWKQMDNYSHKANEISKECPEHVHPHQLRHSWATHALDNGVPIYQISKALGHESVDTTMRYLGVTPNLKTEAMMRTESFVARNTKTNWRKTRSLMDLFK